MNSKKKLTENELWSKANDGDPSILSDPRVSQPMKGSIGNWTPLHRLANLGVKEVLDHPDVSKVKNKNGNTPLHHLAYKGVKEAWLHPDFYKTKNNKDETPKDAWLKSYKPLSTMDLAKLKHDC